jgi:hypothetical protein
MTNIWLDICLITLMLISNGCTIPNTLQASPVSGNSVNGELMGDLVRNEIGGYEIRGIRDFDVKSSDGMVSMFISGGDHQSGPGLYITSELFQTPVSLEKAFDVMVKNEPANVYTQIEKTLIDGSDGISAYFSTTYHALDGIILENPGAAEGETIKGRTIIIVLDDHRLVKCVMLAPEKTWGEYEPIFQQVISSIKFFRAVK